MKTIQVKLIPLGKEILTREGTPFIDLLHGYGVEFPCGGRGTCGKCKVKVLKGDIIVSQTHRDKLLSLGLGTEWRLACFSECSTDLILEVGQFETIIQADQTIFDFKPGTGLGIAFDLGTTTLVGQLMDLSSGKILSVETALNPQTKFGSDLISRLESALSGHMKEMVDLIRQKIGHMIEIMTAGESKPIQQILIVGNTVMQHFFGANDIRPLSYFPFESPDLGVRHFRASELGWRIEAENITFYPSIGSFVGSDILAGIMATGMHTREEYTVLIDLGTNGEIVMGNRKKLLCASTAAGPAFEGAKISMGMLAITGAISSAHLEKKRWNCKVIGNVEPRGICGSGLIDVVAGLLELGLLGGFGEILSGEPDVHLVGPVRITQKDIQEFQLAKSAIVTGLELLRKKLGIGVEDIDRVYISGGFGSYINLDNVRITGMLHFETERMHQLGNSALIGAKMFLFRDWAEVDAILAVTNHVNLESEPGFQDLFIQGLSFTLPGEES